MNRVAQLQLHLGVTDVAVENNFTASDFSTSLLIPSLPSSFRM